MFLQIAILPFLCGITGALVHGIDTSILLSQAEYVEARGEGYTHLVLNGYQEACIIGGRVNPSFALNYQNAKDAGYASIDASWAPCTGSLNRCKPYSSQLSELVQTIEGNSMSVGRIWVQLEKNGLCNSWNYGASRNLAEAKKLLNALKESGRSFGIYSSPGEWTAIFGSRGVVLDASVPLWFATWDGVENLRLSAPFGGWQTAFGKQYTDQLVKKYDLNVFAS